MEKYEKTEIQKHWENGRIMEKWVFYLIEIIRNYENTKFYYIGALLWINLFILSQKCESRETLATSLHIFVHFFQCEIVVEIEPREICYALI